MGLAIAAIDPIIEWDIATNKNDDQMRENEKDDKDTTNEIPRKVKGKEGKKATSKPVNTKEKENEKDDKDTIKLVTDEENKRYHQ